MEKIEVIKDFIKKYNVSNYEISKNTGVSEAGLSSIKNGLTKKPRKVTIDAIYNYLISHYPPNEATYNTKNNNGGDNIYINNTGGSISNSGNKTGQDKENAGQCNEIKEMTKLLNQLHETKIIEIERITKLYNEIISNQNELISQYRKEIESLRQRIKGNNENNKE